MKIKNILLISMFVLSFGLFAQGGNMKEKKEQIRTMKVAFLTTEVDLTTAEAEKFWPIYNTYDLKQFELRQQKLRALQKRLDNGSLNEMSEKDAAAFLSQMENTEDEIYQLRKKFMANLKTIISPTKILKFKKAEEDFNRNLLRQYRAKKRK